MSSAAYYTEWEFDDRRPHFLDSCTLCRKPLRPNHDIFMYRGDVPFCSHECRQEQIDTDEAAEKRWNLSSKSAIRQHPTSESAKVSVSKKAARVGPVAVA